MSKQALQILQVIQDSDLHMTAEEIFLKCKELGLSVSIATVYRNLGIMTNEGIIQKVSIVGEPDRYDKCPDTHEHLFCIKCKKVEDLSTDDFKQLLEEKFNVVLDSYDLSLRIICEECRKKESA